MEEHVWGCGVCQGCTLPSSLPTLALIMPPSGEVATPLWSKRTAMNVLSVLMSAGSSCNAGQLAIMLTQSAYCSLIGLPNSLHRGMFEAHSRERVASAQLADAGTEVDGAARTMREWVRLAQRESLPLPLQRDDAILGHIDPMSSKHNRM